MNTSEFMLISEGNEWFCAPHMKRNAVFATRDGVVAARRWAKIAVILPLCLLASQVAMGSMAPPKLTASCSDDPSFIFKESAIQPPANESIGESLIVGKLEDAAFVKTTVTLTLPETEEFTQCKIGGVDVTIDPNKKFEAVRKDFDATLGTTVDVSGSYQVKDQAATKKDFVAKLHVAAFRLIMNETSEDHLDDVVFIGDKADELHVNSTKIGHTDVNVDVKTDTELTIEISPLMEGSATFDPMTITCPIVGPIQSSRVTGITQSESVGDRLVVGTESITQARSELAFTVSRGVEGAPGSDFDGDGEAYLTSGVGKDTLSNGYYSFTEAPSNVPANKKATYAGTKYYLNNLGNFLTKTSYSTLIGGELEQRHYFDAANVAYAALSVADSIGENNVRIGNGQKGDLGYPEHTKPLRILNITDYKCITSFQADSGPAGQTNIEISEKALDDLSINYQKTGGQGEILGTYTAQFRYP